MSIYIFFFQLTRHDDLLFFYITYIDTAIVVGGNTNSVSENEENMKTELFDWMKLMVEV